MSQVARKGPALPILLGVASAFIGSGIFLDNEVLPLSSDTEEILDGAVGMTRRELGIFAWFFIAYSACRLHAEQ